MPSCFTYKRVVQSVIISLLHRCIRIKKPFKFFSRVGFTILFNKCISSPGQWDPAKTRISIKISTLILQMNLEVIPHMPQKFNSANSRFGFNANNVEATVPQVITKEYKNVRRLQHNTIHVQGMTTLILADARSFTQYPTT